MKRVIFDEQNSENFCLRVLDNRIILVRNLVNFEVFFINKFNFNNIGKFIFRLLLLSLFQKWLFNVVTGYFFRWIVRFNIVGYHFTIKVFNLKLRCFRLRMGFRYRFFVILPKFIEIFNRRRSFMVIGRKFYELLIFCQYIRNIRNLFPYKSKGLVFSLEKVKLKVGKKVKLR